MDFILQKINGEIKHDFVLTAMHAMEYYNWKNRSNYKCVKIDISDIENLSPSLYQESIPIGSIEFVTLFYKHVFNKDMPKPINVPTQLFKYSNREIGNFHLQDESFNDNVLLNKNFDERVFLKSNDIIKHPSNGFYYKKDLINISDINNCQISNIIKNDNFTEYRCFVYKNELVGIQYYCGNFRIFPNLNIIDSMINDYSIYAPISYTLDIGTYSNEDAFVIECHNFYSCGLYGFNDLNVIYNMIVKWHNNFIKNLYY